MTLALRPRATGRWVLRKAGGAAHAIGRVLGRIEASLADDELIRREQYVRVRSAMRAHDMTTAADEAYYRDFYWAWIQNQLRKRGIRLSGAFLDAGCGSGRLTLPLAHLSAPHGGRVSGVDLLPEPVGRARDAAAAASLENVAFHTGDLLHFLAAQPSESFDAVLFLEVGYLLVDLPGHLAQLHRVLRPHGLLLASFRTQHYLALLAAMRRDWDFARCILDARSGHLRGLGWQNWHTASDVVAQLEEHGFSGVELAGVGACSGIEGDPLAPVARPSTLGAAGLEGLEMLEAGLAALRPDTGRYVLAAAVRAS